MKKFFSLVLALVMALSLTTAAWGAEAITTQGALDAAVANGGEITLAAGEYTFPASKIKAGTVLTCEEGTVFVGKTNLNINGATVIGATFTNDGDYLVNSATINGTFKKCVFKDCDGLRYCYAGETVVFEDCVFNTDFYGIHFDGGANDVAFKNCTFTGFNTFGGALTKLTMEGCTFKYNGKGGYNGINLWGNSELTNCKFVFDGSASYEWVDLCSDNQTVTFTGCVVTDGTNTKNIATVVGDYGTGNSITIDSKATDGKYTGGYFNTDPTANVAEGYVVVKDGAFYKVQQAVVAPEGETATGETTNNVAESVQDAVKAAVGSGETTVTAGETKIEFNDTTDMEKFADADAADITTQIVVEDVTETVDAAVKADVEAKVEEQVGEIGEDVVVAAYVEIDIHVFADGEHVGQITELPEKIRVSIPLPAGVTAEAGKKYYVAHEHDGVVELLPATIEGGYVVFYSDTFSTYAVVTQTAPTSAGVALTDKVDMVTTDAAQTKYPNVTVSVHKANAPKDTNKDGRFDVSGNVKYFMMNGQEYVQVNTVSEADYTVYVAGTKTLFGYFKAANPFYYGYGVPFNNFGDKCGQYDDEPVAGTKYYTFETNLYKAVKAGTTENFNLMVGNELVPVELMADKFVGHVAAYSYDKNYKVVGVKCAECGAPATLVPNFASLPKNIQKGVQGVDYFAIGDGQYYYWQAASVAPDTKVESAETFDAGIAMYVGMSVMAAAGSAVVLKKRED